MRVPQYLLTARSFCPTPTQKQFRMIEAWATQKDLDAHGASPWMNEKRTKQQSPAFKDCVPASMNVDLSYVNVF